MQQVNLAAPRSPSFMLLVFGPALLGLLLGIRALPDVSRGGAGFVLAGIAPAALFLAGLG